jgi:hypothetical protein
MITMQQTPKPTAGFALILVLASLLILTTLFAIIQTRSLSYRFWATTEQTILTNQLHNQNTLRLAIALRIAHPDETAFDLGKGNHIILQDVGGLIDLNTATPELLDRLAKDIGVTPLGLRRYRAWRQAGHRVMRVTDFLRVTGASEAMEPRLRAAATVFSGRSGIDPDVASQAALEVAAGRLGPPALLARSIRADFRSLASGSNFQVSLVPGKESERVTIGTVNIGPTTTASRVLELR